MKRADLIAAASAHVRRPDPQRLAEPRDGLRLCQFEPCGRLFRPTREWQVYCDDSCRGKAWRRQRATRT